MVKLYMTFSFQFQNSVNKVSKNVTPLGESEPGVKKKSGSRLPSPWRRSFAQFLKRKRQSPRCNNANNNNNDSAAPMLPILPANHNGCSLNSPPITKVEVNNIQPGNSTSSTKTPTMMGNSTTNNKQMGNSTCTTKQVGNSIGPVGNSTQHIAVDITATDNCKMKNYIPTAEQNNVAGKEFFFFNFNIYSLFYWNIKLNSEFYPLPV